MKKREQKMSKETEEMRHREEGCGTKMSKEEGGTKEQKKRDMKKRDWEQR